MLRFGVSETCSFAAGTSGEEERYSGCCEVTGPGSGEEFRVMSSLIEIRDDDAEEETAGVFVSSKLSHRSSCSALG